MIVPAPVVPPAREDDSSVGDWWMVKSCSPMDTSSVEARESTKPRFPEGISWEKRRKDSIYLHHISTFLVFYIFFSFFIRS